MKTLGEAILLVILVIFLFLQDWRATLIPTITIPVSLIGTFAFIKAFGFSINTLTLFGIVLATGLVVDDAIVVVENIERNLSETRGDTREAARRAMGEVAGAVVATSLVLIAVFVPGGVHIRNDWAAVPAVLAHHRLLGRHLGLQFADAVAGAGRAADAAAPRASERRRFVVFRWFNRGLRRHPRALSAGARLAAGAPALGRAGVRGRPGADRDRLPERAERVRPRRGPELFHHSGHRPQGASLELHDGHRQAGRGAAPDPPRGPEHLLGARASTSAATAPTGPSIFSSLKPISERPGAAHAAPALVGDLQLKLLAIPGALVIPFLPPPIQGQGSTGGFTFELLDKSSSADFTALAQASEQLMGEATRTGRVGRLFTTFSVDDPQLSVDIDRDKAKSIGVPIGQIGDALGVYLGSQYVNDFDFVNRSYRVYAQAAAPFRASRATSASSTFASQAGGLVALDNLVRLKLGRAPPVISHFNLYPIDRAGGHTAAGRFQRPGHRRHAGGGAQGAAARTWATSGRACPGRRCAPAARR